VSPSSSSLTARSWSVGLVDIAITTSHHLVTRNGPRLARIARLVHAAARAAKQQP